jgi:hypothetical protein
MALSLSAGDTVKLRAGLACKPADANVYKVLRIVPAPAGPVCLLQLLCYVSDEPEGAWNPPHELSTAPADALELVSYSPDDYTLPGWADDWNEWLELLEAERNRERANECGA